MVTRSARPTIGVLALQGGFDLHLRALERVGASAVPVRTATDLERASGLVLPGGESSAQLRLLASSGLEPALRDFFAARRPVLATCAGLILLARRVTRPEQRSLGWIDVAVERNAWGRQVDSFEATADDGALPLVFIRAPRITDVGPDVEVLATYRGEPVLVREGSVTGATFHPELTAGTHVHEAALASALGVG